MRCLALFSLCAIALAVASAQGGAPLFERGTIGSARLAGGRWIRWTPPCAGVGHSFAFPAVSSARDLVAVCVMGGFAHPLSRSAPPGAKLRSSWLYLSADGGAGFRAGPELPNHAGSYAAVGGPIASPVPGAILFGAPDPKTGREALIASFDGGMHWSVVASGAPAFVGFTSPSQGSRSCGRATGPPAC
jgi:hypothetical protein